MSLVKGYQNWSELVMDAPVVVVGVAVSSREETGWRGIPVTITAFAVETLVLACDGQAHQVVHVQQFGPIPPNMWVEDTWPLPVIGDRYLLFLTPALRSGVYFPVGAYQGVFHVTRGDQVQPIMPDIPALNALTEGTTLETVLEAIRAAR
jgi:hypothetical protein